MELCLTNHQSMFHIEEKFISINKKTENLIRGNNSGIKEYLGEFMVNRIFWSNIYWYINYILYWYSILGYYFIHVVEG